MEEATAGDPMSSVKWSRKSTRAVSRELKVSPTKAWHMLKKAEFRLRTNRKRLARKSSEHREEQFQIIKRLKKSFSRGEQPIISVDAKKRELVGEFKNAGRVWRQAPRDVNMYDFPSDADGVAIPYGIFDVSRGDGFVVIGTTHNTPAFAAHSINEWWVRGGQAAHPGARKVLILADSGSSNGARARDWKEGLQAIANRTGLGITVAHYPSGASKWNPVEHRLFGPISINWAGQPLRDYQTVCNFIGSTRTTSGAACGVVVDHNSWPTQKELAAAGIKRPPAMLLNIKHGSALPHLNYTISPVPSPRN